MADAASPGGARSAKVTPEPLPVRYWDPDGAVLVEGILNQPIPTDHSPCRLAGAAKDLDHALRASASIERPHDVIEYSW